MSMTSKFRKIRDGMSAAIAAVGVASLIAGAVVLGAAGSAQGAEQEVPCGTPAQEAVYETIHHPAQPAVYETVVVQEGKEAWTEEIEHPAVPPVYDTVVVGVEYEYVHRNPGHPQSPRWEVDGWNAESNPGSDGWTKTGETREVTEQVLVSEGKDAWTEVIDHPEVPEITEERLVTPAKEAWTEEKLVSPAVPAGPPCVEEPETSPPPVTDVCTNLPGDQATVPVGFTGTDGVCVEDVVAGDEGEESEPKSKPERVQPAEVLDAEAVPTAVAAGLGGPVAPVGSSAGLLGQGLVAAGLLMLLLAGSAQLGRRRRGAHEV
jgi:hypothetical protein